MNPYILPVDLLPMRFQYPREYIEMASTRTFPNLGLWFFMGEVEGQCERILKVLQRDYPDRCLVPFAALQINDDISCFDGNDLSGNPRVHFIHLGTEPGWEERGQISNFSEWLNYAEGFYEQYLSEIDEE